MIADWFRAVGQSPGGLPAESRFQVDPGSLFFSGHFPGQPVLPGIAILAMVRETLRQATGDVRFPAGFRRVRFRSLIEGATVCTVRLLASAPGKGTGNPPGPPPPDRTACGASFAEQDTLSASAPGHEPSSVPFEVLARDQVTADGLLVTASCGALQLPEPGERAVTPPEPIETFLPHRDRMRVASRILRVQTCLCEVEAAVLPSWPLVSDDRADSVVLLELLAQTAAAMTGWEERETPGGGGRGFLVGSRFFTTRDSSVPAGALCRSVVHSLRQRDNYRVFQGQVFGPDGAVLAEGELQAFRP